jgi:hypothetical protein
MAKETQEFVNILRQTDIFYDLTESQMEMVAGLCSETTSLMSVNR